MKTNKQGVRDLNGPASRAKAKLAAELWPAIDFGRNQMPPELAAQMLERENAVFDYSIRTIEASVAKGRARDEMLTVLAEECAETTQACTKILRFGAGVNPYTGTTTQASLEDELGQVIAAALVLAKYGGINLEAVERATERRLADYKRNEAGRLRHASAEGVEA